MPCPAILAALLALLGSSHASAQASGVLAGAAVQLPSAGVPSQAGKRSLLGVDPALLKLIKLPPGFKIRTYTDDFVDARNLAIGNRGSSKPVVVYVSTTGDKVAAGEGLRFVDLWSNFAKQLASGAYLCMQRGFVTTMPGQLNSRPGPPHPPNPPTP